MKKSFNEIIRENLIGKWCDGLVLLHVYDDAITIENIYSHNGKSLGIDGYPISVIDERFSKVEEMSYKEAIKELLENNKTIISPKVENQDIITFEGIRYIEYGGNIYNKTKDNKIIVNKKHKFNTLSEISGFGLISKEEVENNWNVF